MPLVDGNELRPEAETDDRDIDPVFLHGSHLGRISNGSSSLSDLNVKSLISLEFMFLARKTKLNDINMLSIKPTSSPTGC